MKTWFTTRELTGLPGMPKTVQAVTRKAKRERYLAKWRDGHGGGKEYHLSCLPEATQDSLYCREKESHPVTAPTMNEVLNSGELRQDLTSLKKWQRDIMTARLALYREFEELKKMYGTNRAADKLVALAKAEALPEHLQKLVSQANARKGKAGRTLSRSMVLGWQRKVNYYGVGGLAPKAIDKNKVPDWAPYFHKVFQRPQKPSIPEAMAEMEKIMPEDIPMPSYHQVRRYNNKRSRLEREKGRHSGGALKRFKGYCIRSTDNLLPTDVVQCDGHSFKAKVAHPFHGRPFKPEVCAVIDVKTKMALGWSSGLAESAHTVADALRHAMTVNDAKPWGGVPSILYTDKGAGNMAKMLGDEVTGVLVRAGITHHTGIPGNAQGRGLVEKTNQKLWISAARKLDTFVGKGMDELEKRKVYLHHEKEVRETGTCVLSDLPSWPQFLEICEQSIRDYNNTPHSGLKKIKDSATGRIRHMTPAEAWFTAIREGWNPTLLDPAILEDLFRPQITRTTNRAMVSLFNNTYFNPVLEHYHGSEVIVEYDIHDAKVIRVRDMEQRLICLAQFERNKRDFFPTNEVERAGKQRAERRKLLLERKMEEVEAERKGHFSLDAETADLLIEADPGAVERQTSGINQDVIKITHIQPHADDIIYEPAATTGEQPKTQHLVSTKSEQFNIMLNDLRQSPRPLNHEECAFLNDYYQEEGGRMYLQMVGDLRVEFGVSEEDQAGKQQNA